MTKAELLARLEKSHLSRAARFGLKCRVCWVESREQRRKTWWGIGICPGCGERHTLFAPAKPPSPFQAPYDDKQPPAALMTWGEALTDWLNAAQAYKEARAEDGFHPGEEARAELETSLTARDAWLALCDSSDYYYIWWHVGPEPWELQERAEHNARRAQARHPDQLWFHQNQFGHISR